MGRVLSKAERVAAQVRTVHQLRQALTRVARALPKGVITVVKARLMPSIVRGVAAAMEVTTGSQLPSAPSRGEPSEPLCRAAAHAEQDRRSVGARMSWMLHTVGMHEAVHCRGSVV
jgi:hypothetical protein